VRETYCPSNALDAVPLEYQSSPLCSASDSLFPGALKRETARDAACERFQERFPIFSNLCYRNSSLQASRLTSQKHDKRPHLTNHFGKNVKFVEKLVKDCASAIQGQPKGAPSADHLPRARGTLSAYAFCPNPCRCPHPVGHATIARR
jgi:hypothetical protein